MTKRRLFFISFATTVLGTLAFLYVTRPQSRRFDKPLNLIPVATDVYVTSQLTPADLSSLKKQGIQSLVDIRPDGEADDQPSSTLMGTQAKLNQLNFFYIPVPHESIPPEAVSHLGDVLSQKPHPTVLYCRGGRRAVRIFALAEASRDNGPSAVAIQAMVQKAGFTAEDLSAEITQRLGQRKENQTAHK